MSLRRSMLAVAVLVTLGAPVSGGDKGFLFRPPTGTLTLRGGFDRAGAGGELFGFVTDRLTVSRGDFGGATLAAEVAVALTDRVSVTAGLASVSTRRPSEFRNWLDERDQPIRQTTEFDRLPITVGAKAYLVRPGQPVGRFAWVPSRFAPYVAGGGGMMAYTFRQRGSFVDESTSRVFIDNFESSGWAPTFYAAAGGDVTLLSQVLLSAEARYFWARSDLSTDFTGFDPIDLSGLSFTAGLSIRY